MTDQNKPTTKLVNALGLALAPVKVASLVRCGMNDLARSEGENAELGSALSNEENAVEDYLPRAGHFTNTTITQTRSGGSRNRLLDLFVMTSESECKWLRI